MAKQVSGYLIADDRTLAGEEVRYAGRNATSLGDMERLRAAVKVAGTAVITQTAP